MIKNMKKQLKNEKGLTLVELLAVIVILAIIAAIAIPSIGNIVTNSKYNAVKADALNVLNAAQMYYLDDADGTGNVEVSELIDENYLETAGSIDGKATVSRDTPLKLSEATVEYASGKEVTFDGATIESINKDDTKGSKETVITIDATKTTVGSAG